MNAEQIECGCIMRVLYSAEDRPVSGGGGVVEVDH